MVTVVSLGSLVTVLLLSPLLAVLATSINDLSRNSLAVVGYYILLFPSCSLLCFWLHNSHLLKLFLSFSARFLSLLLLFLKPSPAGP